MIKQVAHRRLRQVRELYQFECGYCRVSEVDAGGELSVDHYQPVSAGGSDTDDNLVYACFRCNLLKADYWHENSYEEVLRILHPLNDDLDKHILPDRVTGKLHALTETGRFHVAILDLNRPQLVIHRQRKAIRELYRDIEESLTAELAKLEAEIRAYERYVVQLERLLNTRFD